MVWAWVLAVGLAAILAYIELRSRLRSMPTSRAKGWWAARLALEGTLGALALAGVGLAISPDFRGLPPWLVLGLAGGLAGPAVARLSVATVGRGDKQRNVGIALAYDPLRWFLEDRIDEIGAAEQTNWITDKTRSLLRDEIPSASLGASLSSYVASLTRLSETERLAEQQWIKETMQESSYSEEDRLRALLTRAATLRYWTWLKDVVPQLRAP